MACTWGTKTLTISHGTYTGPHSANNAIEIPILAGEGPASIVQQNGRGRIRVSFVGIVEDISDYTTLHTDYLALTPKTFTGPDHTGTMMIFDLGPAEYVSTNYIQYSITFMEV